MTLTNKAYLRIDDRNGQAVFEFNHGLEHNPEGQRSFIVGERGQYIREIVNQASDQGGIENVPDRRAGFWVDGGAGSWQHSMSFETGLEDVQWGDGSGGTGPANVTRRDASGADVKPISRLCVLEFWLMKTLIDSNSPAYLFWGEWTSNGTDIDFVNPPEGVYSNPMPVTIVDWNFSKPPDDPSAFTGQIEMQKLTPFADVANVPDFMSGGVDDFFDAITGALEDIPDE